MRHEMYDDKQAGSWEEINPGNSVKGKAYFDVPEGAKPPPARTARLDVLRWR